MTEHKFQKGDIVRLYSTDYSFNGSVGTIEKLQGDRYCYVSIPFRGEWLCEASKLVLIKPAKPQRYTGELREGMKVWMVDNDTSTSNHTGERTVFGNNSEWILKKGDWWEIFVRNDVGEWWSPKRYFYISHVISEPEQETTPSMHVHPDGFAVPNLQPLHYRDGVTIKNSPHKGVIKNLMDSMFDLYLNNFDKNSLRFKKYALRVDGGVKAEVLFGALVTWNTKIVPKFIDQLNNHLAEIEKREKEEAKR